MRSLHSVCKFTGMRNTILFLIMICTACQTTTENAAIDKEQIAKETKDIAKNVVDIQFELVENISSLVKEYPFLKGDLSGLTLSDPMETEIFIAKAKVGENSFIFTRLEGPLYRGTEGSPVEVYLDQGKGYKHALSVTTHPNITIITTPSLALLLPLADDTKAKWIFNKDAGLFILSK